MAKEGIFAGNSCGAAVKVQFSLKNTSQKMMSLWSYYMIRVVDMWVKCIMTIGCVKEALEQDVVTAGDLVNAHENKPLVTVFAEELVSHAIGKMRKFGISQIRFKRQSICRLC